jgi:hypothetical protein
MTRTKIAVSSALVVVSVVLSLQGQEQSKPKDDQHPSFWMKKKLEFSQEILAGLAKADFEKIGKSAKQMQGLNKIEDFVRGRNENYHTQLKAFDYASQELIRYADDENIDGAALAYMQLTLSCINCHKHLRHASK